MLAALADVTLHRLKKVYYTGLEPDLLQHVSLSEGASLTVYGIGTVTFFWTGSCTSQGVYIIEYNLSANHKLQPASPPALIQLSTGKQGQGEEYLLLPSRHHSPL